MGLLDTYRINKAITVLLTSQDAASAETMQAVATLKRLGQSAIPKLIEALGQSAIPRTPWWRSDTLVQNATLPLFGDGLASSNPRVVAGVVEVLTQATTYDPNRLLDFFTDPRIAKSTLGKLLNARKATLQPEPLLRCLDTVRAEHRPLLLGLVRQVATVATVPALIRRTASTDETVRLAMVRTLTRFRTEEVRDAFMGLLTDPHAPIREAALDRTREPAITTGRGTDLSTARDPEKSRTAPGQCHSDAMESPTDGIVSFRRLAGSLSGSATGALWNSCPWWGIRASIKAAVTPRDRHTGSA